MSGQRVLLWPVALGAASGAEGQRFESYWAKSRLGRSRFEDSQLARARPISGIQAEK